MISRPVLAGVALLMLLSTGLAGERTPWLTSRVVGAPEPPLPFRTERVFPQVNFVHPTLVAVAPGMDRLFVGEQAGKLWSFRMADQTEKELVIELPAVVEYPPNTTFDALYGMAFDPQFTENRYVYLCYVLKPKADAVLPEGSRISRFTMTETNPPRLDPKTEKFVLGYRAGGHNGGCLEFGPDGCLYISTGDATGPNPPDKWRTGQDCSDLMSSILRIDVRHSSGDRRYAVPEDNPFVDLPKVRPEVWAFGFRNPWKMTFDRDTGELWVADVGWDNWETVNVVPKGGNFGWGAYEGRQPILPDVEIGPTPVLPPLIELPHTISASVTGGYVYRGKKFPELRGEYIFGDYETKSVWGARRDPAGQGVLRDLADSGLQIVAFGQDHDGELYLADYGQGVLHTLVRNEQAGQPSAFPRKLSDTGLFIDVVQQVPAAGVLPFEINQPQWSDFATGRRWIAMPGTAPIVWHPGDVPIPGSMFSRQHDYPAGTVLVKTLSLEMTHGDPRSSKNIETQLLHFDGRSWRAYTYAWNDSQTDAELVPALGAETALTVKDARWSGGQRVHRWSFTSRVQCLSCHSPWAQQTLAFTPAQLHRDVERDGQQVNQLRWLEGHGVFRRVGGDKQTLPPFTAATLAAVPALARRDDRSATAAQAVRSYLHVNCSHCHRFNGGGAGSFELLLKLSDKQLQAINELPRQGTFDIANAKLIAPGDPSRSLLYVRMAKFGRGRMPHLGSEYVDDTALHWLESWIAGLADPDAKPAAAVVDADISGLSSWPTALQMARGLERGQFNPKEQEALLVAAASHPSNLVQDLFAGYQPPERRRATLGSVIVPATILARTGDAQRGEHLFWKSAGLACRNCHKVDVKGGDIGPELRQVASKRTRAELLEELLEPSKKIEPKYATHVVQTHDGRAFSGLLIQRDAQHVILRDAQGKDASIPSAQIEEFQKSNRSLMPDGQLRDLTLQEAADLLAYLESLKPR